MRRVRFHAVSFAAVLAISAVTLIAEVCRAGTRPACPANWHGPLATTRRPSIPPKSTTSIRRRFAISPAGVLLRFNRLTQTVEPQLAQSWNVSPDGKTIVFKMRPGLRFSDGSSLTSRDAAWSIRRVLLPATAAPVADEFINAGRRHRRNPRPSHGHRSSAPASDRHRQGLRRDRH